MRPKVLILGCGPAGLIAAQAAAYMFRGEVKIISVKRPSQLYGCQYLHEPIPGVEHGGPEMVRYILRGTTEGYRRKVYGNLPLPVSPQQYAGNHLAWDIRRAYQKLWEKFENNVIDARLNPTDIVPMLGEFVPDVCISSLPAPVICQKGDSHSFSSVNCWAIGDSPYQRVSDRGYVIEPFHILCSGEDSVSWYRACNVFGYSTVEWPGHKSKPPVKDVVQFSKPLSTDCDCLPSILRVGRYGRWEKGVLSHQAFNSAMDRLKGL